MLWELTINSLKKSGAHRTHLRGHSQSPLRGSLLGRQVLTPTGSSTLDHVQREAGQRSLLVARLHIEACLVHGLDDLIERDLVAF